MQEKNEPAITLKKDNKGSELWHVYTWTLSYIRPYTFTFLLILFLVIILTTSELAIPKFIQFFVDSVLPSSNRTIFFISVVLLSVIFMCIVLSTLAQNILRKQLQEKAARDVQLAIFQHLRKLGFDYYEKTPTGKTLSLLNTEVGALQELYKQSFPLLLENVIFSIVSLIYMAFTSPKLTLIVLPCLLLYFLFGPRLERKASLHAKNLSQNRIDENQKVYESISAIMEIRAYSAESWDFDRFIKKVGSLNKSMMWTYWYNHLRGTNRRLIYYAGGIVILFSGYSLFKVGSLSAGELMAFILYFFITMQKLTAVITNISEQRILIYQAEKLYRFLKLRPTITECKEPIVLNSLLGEIIFREVTFHYSKGKRVLNRLNLTISPGEHVAIVGASGNGKSTILKLVGRFYDPDEGEILLDGVPLKNLSIMSIREGCGYVFQDTYLFGGSVRDNIQFGKPDATYEEIMAVAKIAQAHDFIMQLPEGYDTIVGERGQTLSGGQKQRISIARMLIRNPAVILLDEATSALDSASEQEVQKALSHLLKGRTVISVAHRLSTIRDFDRIIVLENGKVEESGSYDELVRGRGIFYQLVGGK